MQKSLLLQDHVKHLALLGVCLGKLCWFKKHAHPTTTCPPPTQCCDVFALTSKVVLECGATKTLSYDTKEFGPVVINANTFQATSIGSIRLLNMQSKSSLSKVLFELIQENTVCSSQLGIETSLKPDTCDPSLPFSVRVTNTSHHAICLDLALIGTCFDAQGECFPRLWCAEESHGFLEFISVDKGSSTKTLPIPNAQTVIMTVKSSKETTIEFIPDTTPAFQVVFPPFTPVQVDLCDLGINSLKMSVISGCVPDASVFTVQA